MSPHLLLLSSSLLLILYLIKPSLGLMEVIVPSQRVFKFAFNPIMFNWTRDGNPVLHITTNDNNEGDNIQRRDTHIQYTPSIKDQPDMPHWMRYKYSHRHQAGFIYGVPPLSQDFIDLDVVAWNKDTWALGFMELRINITDNVDSSQALNALQLKIDNLNLEDIFEAHRLRNLKSIFKKLLWTESSSDLHLTFISSSLDVGYRRPLHPGQKDGVVIHLGSNANFSEQIHDLDRETSPLRKKFETCPTRNFARTTVTRHFRLKGFGLDWCAFHLLHWENGGYTNVGELKNNVLKPLKIHGNLSYQDKSISNANKKRLNNFVNWHMPNKSQLPTRDLTQEYLISLTFPLIIMTLMGILMSILICCKSKLQSSEDEWEGFLESFFLVLLDCCQCCCFRDTKKNLTHSEDDDPKASLIQPVVGPSSVDANRYVRASSVQRQTDTLRRNARLREREITPRLTSPGPESPRGSMPHLYIATNNAGTDGGGRRPRSTLEPSYRPKPPPYYGTGSMSNEKSYLV